MRLPLFYALIRDAQCILITTQPRYLLRRGPPIKKSSRDLPSPMSRRPSDFLPRAVSSCFLIGPSLPLTLIRIKRTTNFPAATLAIFVVF